MKWKTYKIDEIKAEGKYTLVGGPFGSNLTTRDYVEEGIPVLRGTNLPFEKRFSHDDFVFVSEEKAQKLKPNLAFPKDVLFTQRGTLGQIGLIPEGFYEVYVVSQSQMKLTVNPKLALPEFIYYFFSTEAGRKNIEAHSITSGVPHINLSILKNLEIPLPPLPTQQKIASILSTYDDLIENNLKRIRLLEEAAQRLYQEWFVRFRFPGWEEVRFLEGLPEGWEKIKIGDICKVKGGKRLPNGSTLSEHDTGFPYVRVKDFTSSGVNLESVQFIDEDSQALIKKYTISTDEIYISNAGTIGLVGIIPTVLDGANLTENCAKLSEITVPYYKNYLCWFLKGTEGQSLIKSNIVSSSQPKLALYRIANISLTLPEKTTLMAYDRLIELFSKQIEGLTTTNRKLKKARNILLPRLMNQTIEI